MSSCFDRALPRRNPNTQVSGPGEQVSWRLADAREERREKAREAARKRKEERP